MSLRALSVQAGACLGPICPAGGTASGSPISGPRGPWGRRDHRGVWLSVNSAPPFRSPAATSPPPPSCPRPGKSTTFYGPGSSHPTAREDPVPLLSRTSTPRRPTQRAWPLTFCLGGHVAAPRPRSAEAPELSLLHQCHLPLVTHHSHAASATLQNKTAHVRSSSKPSSSFPATWAPKRPPPTSVSSSWSRPAAHLRPGPWPFTCVSWQRECHADLCHRGPALLPQLAFPPPGFANPRRATLTYRSPAGTARDFQWGQHPQFPFSYRSVHLCSPSPPPTGGDTQFFLSLLHPQRLEECHGRYPANACYGPVLPKLVQMDLEGGCSIPGLCSEVQIRSLLLSG